MLGLLAGSSLGQVTLSVGSGSAAPGGTISVPLSVNSNGGTQPAALEWGFTYDPADFSSVRVTASATGRLVDCVSAAQGQQLCMLSGPTATPLANGTVATATLTLSNQPSGTTGDLQISGPLAVSPVGDALPASGTGGSIGILPPPVELKDLTCTPAIFQGPGTSGCTVLLGGAAPTGGVTASLGFSSTGVSPTMPTELTIPAGASSGNFAVQVGGVTAVTTIT
ncbi:MAG: hypothetical protein FJW37_00130 [Acidobacteria bacterium]|nr:hypothetical protein [Acidobacteriota bacterium]